MWLGICSRTLTSRQTLKIHFGSESMISHLHSCSILGWLHVSKYVSPWNLALNISFPICLHRYISCVSICWSLPCDLAQKTIEICPSYPAMAVTIECQSYTQEVGSWKPSRLGSSVNDILNLIWYDVMQYISMYIIRMICIYLWCIYRICIYIYIYMHMNIIYIHVCIYIYISEYNVSR